MIGEQVAYCDKLDIGVGLGAIDDSGSTAAATEAVTEAATEAPTEAPTEPPTEAPTEPPTEAPTEAPAEEPAPEALARSLHSMGAAAPAAGTWAAQPPSALADGGRLSLLSRFALLGLQVRCLRAAVP